MTDNNPPEHARKHWLRAPYTSVSFWAFPMVVIMVVAMLGTALYLGGLSTPTDFFKDFPVAVVNQDKGAQVPQQDGSSEQQNLGRQIVDKFADEAGKDDRVDLRELSWEQAQEQMDRGDLYAAVVIPESFSKNTVSLVEGSLTQGSAARPEVTLYTDPQAGSIGTKLATGAVDPGITQASEAMGKELTGSIDSAQQQAHDRVLEQLKQNQQEQSQQMAKSAAQGGPAVQQFAQQVQQAQEQSVQQIAENLSPKVSSVSRQALADPVQVVSKPYQQLEDGTALGMGAFYYCILLLVVGLSGSVALNVLMDGRMGAAPFEMGPFFRDNPRRIPSRVLGFLIKWGTFTVAAAPTSALMMWVASMVGVPVPHGVALFFLGWLALSTVSAIVLALITLGGSAGMLISMIYLVFMGLPSAGAVVPLQAVPGFFRAIAQLEPLHHIFLAVRSVLYFDADPHAGLQSGVIALFVMLALALAVALVGGWAYDRFFGKRGTTGGPKHVAGRGDRAAATPQTPATGGQFAAKSADNPRVPAGHRA